MRIGIDGTPLTIPFHCGQRHYLENLIFGLAKIDKRNKYVIFATKKVPIPNQKNFTLILIADKFPVFKRQLIMPLVARRQKLDVFHYPDVWRSVFFNFPKAITTLHDRAPSSSYPKWYESAKYTFMRKFNDFVRSLTLKNSSAVIVPSKFIAKDAAGLIQSKIPIIPIHHGVSSNFAVIKSIRKNNHFLAMADFSPRKNIFRIMEAYSLFLKKRQKKINLYIIISTSDPKKGILNKARELNILKFIKILEDVSLKQLVALYNKSLCLIYPSLYEGFGLPIIEAMACGCPVITSNYGAMKEVADDAAYLVNPRSISQIKNSIEKIAESPKLSEILRERGLKRAKLFSWEKTARETLKVYKSVYLNG